MQPAMWQPGGGGGAGGGCRRSPALLGPRRAKRSGPALGAPEREVSAPRATTQPSRRGVGAGARGRGAGSPGPLTHLRHGRVRAGGGGRAGIPGCGVVCSLATAPREGGAPERGLGRAGLGAGGARATHSRCADGAAPSECAGGRPRVSPVPGLRRTLALTLALSWEVGDAVNKNTDC